MSILSHVPIAFLLLGALAPLFVLAVMWERKEINRYVRRSVDAPSSSPAVREQGLLSARVELAL